MIIERARVVVAETVYKVNYGCTDDVGSEGRDEK